MHPWLSKRPFQMHPIGLRTFRRGLNNSGSPHCTDSTPIGLRTQLETELSAVALAYRLSGPAALGDHFALLFCKRSVDVKREVITVSAEVCNDEMHSVLHKPSNEVHVAGEPI